MDNETSEKARVLVDQLVDLLRETDASQFAFGTGFSSTEYWVVTVKKN